MFSLNAIVHALDQHEPVRLREPDRLKGRAAVAMILAGAAADLRLCFMLRAKRRGDPWSGQMAFPGGRAESGDRSALEVAQRETLEEVGLKLETSQHIGDLSEMPISYRGTDTGSVLSPFVFYVGKQLPELTPNEEAAATYWIPLAHLWNGGNCDTVEWMHNGRNRVFAGIRYDGQVVWGLTYRVLEMFAALLDKPLPCGSALA